MDRQQSSDVVVITGASAGVGRAVARLFGERRARVGLLARGVDGLEAAKREIEAAGGQALAIPTDVSDPAQIERAAERVEAAFGPIDIWINNAMASVFAPVLELTAEELRRVTEVTYLGYAYGTMTALRRMVPRDRGTIVQVGSALAYRGIPLQAAYCAAKHAIEGFNDSLHAELLHDRSSVRLTMVNLPAVNTPQFDWVLSKLPNRAQPVPPIYQPELIAEAIMWAAYHYRRSWNIGWPATKAIVGNNLAPEYADHYLARHGYDGQQTAEPEDPARRNNLWEPLPGDHGARGRFTDRAKAHSAYVVLNRHREPLLLAAAALAGCAMLASAVAGRMFGGRRRRNLDDVAT
jgi:NAD(P)-dependent dehydrogenase (short-subunit alcohol dehydrogenase family)